MRTTTSWGFVLLAVAAAGCTNGSGPTLARPNTQSVKSQARQQALGGNGLAATATFDAPVIDANSAGQFTPGSGSFTVAPSTTGGNASLGVLDSSSQPAVYYVMVGDFSGASTAPFFAVLSDVAFTAGAHPIDNVHYFAGLFDAQTGDPTHLATSGTVTFTQAGGIGGRWVGSFSGDVEAVQQAPGCQSTADCATGEVCSNGTCVRAPPPQCTSNAQCAAGNVCQAGVCVPVPTGCTSSAQCAAGQICASGQCVTLTPVCQTDADCSRGETCQSGTCVTSPPQCTSNAQCPVGWACQGGQCTPGSTGGACEGQQGDGTLSGSLTTVASCAAIPSGNVAITAGVAMIDDQLRLVIFDPSAATEGVELELTVCPGAPGTLSLGNGLVSAAHIKDVQTPGLRLYAERKASSASLTLTRVSPSLAGSFALTLTTGGSVNGTFSMH